MSLVTRSWIRIERWLRANRILSALRAPASDTTIARAERRLGVQFPTDYRESLRHHDGESVDPEHFILGGWLLLPLRYVVQSYEDERRAPPAEFWNRHWIPVASSGAGDHYCIDLSSGSVRARGILRFGHEYEERPILFPSFGAMLENAAAEMEAGLYVLEEGRVERTDGHMDSWARDWYNKRNRTRKKRALRGSKNRGGVG